MKKVALIASMGGHLDEISRFQKLGEKHECFLVTENGGGIPGLLCDKQYYVPQINRKEIFFPLKFLYICLRALYIISRERPDFIVTTGALMAYPFCVIAKLKDVKIIYIESFARVYYPSLTGKLLYNFSDLFVVQWKEMLKRYPKSVLGGGIY